MKYCCNCGSEAHDYVDMCQNPNCNSLFFQNEELTLHQKQENKKKDKLYSTLDTVILCFGLFLVSSIIASVTSNFIKEHFFIYIVFMAVYIWSSVLYFLFYIITKKIKLYALYTMMAMNILSIGIVGFNRGNIFFSVFHSIMNSILFIAFYLALKNRFSKNDLVEICCYIVLGINLVTLANIVVRIFNSRYFGNNLFLILYQAISIVLYLLLALVAFKFLNRKANRKINIYFNLYNIILFIDITMIVMLLLHNIILVTESQISIFTVIIFEGIIFNAALFLSISKHKDYKKVLKIGVGMVISFNVITIFINSFDVFFQNRIILSTYVFTGIVPAIIFVIRYFINNRKIKVIETNTSHNKRLSNKPS